MIADAKGTILLIEDDLQYQEHLKVVFRIAGYNTRLAMDAGAGFAALENGRIDLVVLDYRLPGMDGLQFFEVLLADRKYAHLRGLPIVVMTGFPITCEEKRRFMRMGAKAIITKGTGFKELVQIIDKEVESYKAITSFDNMPGRNFSLPDYLAYVEKQIILRAMIRNPESSQDSIARELGIPRSTLSRKLGEYNLRLR